jgi:hypothetical protein
MKPNLNIKAIIDEAFAAASVATTNYLASAVSEYPCGFAWVNIRPARGPLVAALKELQLGRTDDYQGGFSVRNPSKNCTQSMDATQAGAVAFNATPCTRLD